MKNNKKIFLALTLIILLLGVSTAVAADNDTASSTDVVSETTVSTDNAVVTEEVQTSTDNDIETKKLEKEDKSIKDSTKTVEVNNYNELTSAINAAVNDADNDEYVISLNEGTYNINNTKVRILNGLYKPNITINANNQNLTGEMSGYLRIECNSNITINDAIISHRILNWGNMTINNCYINLNPGYYIYNREGSGLTINSSIINSEIKNVGNLNISDSSVNQKLSINGTVIISNSNINGDIDLDTQLYISNSTINGTMINYGRLTLADDVSLGNGFQYKGQGVININNTNIIYPYITSFTGNSSLSNITINENITNNGNLTLTNTTLNSTLKNNGNLVISDDTIFADNFVLEGNGAIIINDTNKLAPYLSTYQDEYTFVNVTVNKTKTNYGTITYINSTLNATINNNGNLIIGDNNTFGENFKITGNGDVITNDTKIAPYLSKYNGTFTLENIAINDPKTNHGNLTLNNCTIIAQITNYGNVTFKNCTVNSQITNYGNLTISEDVVFEENFKISGNGQIITSNIYNLLPYMSEINGNYTLENLTFEKGFTFRGDITLKNCSFIQDPAYSRAFENYGILVLNNCTVNLTYSLIRNYGIIVINDNSQIITPERIINQDGTIFNGERPESFNPTKFNEDQIIENLIFNVPSTNNANLTLINCTINAKITNNANLTLINCSLSNNNFSYVLGKIGYLISNYGNLLLDNVEVSNNSINYETNQPIDDKYGGLILNEANLTVYNSNFTDNHIGDSKQTDAGQEYSYNYGYVVGCGIIYNNNRGNISIYDSTFDNNTAGHSGSCIYMTSNYNTNAEEDKLIIDNTNFTNNTARVQGGALYLSSPNATITNSYFENNNVINQINTGYTYELTGGAIYTNFRTGKSNYYIENTTFKNNGGYNDGYTWAYLVKYGISNSRCNFTLNNDTFDSCNVSSGSNDLNANFFTVLNNSNIQNSSHISIGQYMRANITNNRFTNNGSLHLGTQSYPSNSGATNYQEYITNNTFINNTGAETILIGENINNTIIANNTYLNTKISDTLELDIPTNIYIGEPTTIKGTYTINNPEYYDPDILEQNQFNVYINGELDQTVDTLEFTITPTESNMILTVQPTISQTRKSAMIQASTLNITLEDITATIGENTQLTAHITYITDDTPMEVNTGRVYFKVNGKILRDTETGRILYADVTDNTATLDYTVPKTWNTDTEITAVFTGNDEIPQKTSQTVNPTITTPETSETEFTVANTTATAGSEVTITVTTKNLDNGKVVLKVNGKTVKAADGKLYAKVTGDTTTFTYIVPKTYKAGDYDIKAVYTSGATKLESDNKLTVE